MNDVKTTLRWWQLAAIPIGAAFSAPLFIFGMDLDRSVGNLSATLGVFLGNFFLFAIAILSGLSGTWRCKSLTECASEIFGTALNPLYVSIAGSMSVYWFVSNVQIMSGEIERNLFTEHFSFAQPIIKISLIVFIAMIVAPGIKSLFYVGTTALSLAIPLALYALYELYFSDLSVVLPAERNLAPLTFQGVSIVIGIGIMGAIDLPTLMNRSRSIQDNVIACILIFACALPIILMLGISFHSLYGDHELKEFIQVLLGQKFSMIWLFLIFFVTSLSGCLLNLYSGFINITTIYPKISYRSVLFLLCFIALLISLFDTSDTLKQFLNSLSIVLTSMGSVIVFEFIYRQTSYHFMDIYEVNLIAWGAGIIVGIISLNGWIIFSEIPTLDAFLASGTIKLIQFLTSRYVYVSYSLDTDT